MGFIAKGIKSVVKAVVGVVKGVVKALGKVVTGLIGMVSGRGNAANAATDGRLSKTLEPEDCRKIIFGKTALATDLRFWEVHNEDYEDFSEVLAAAGHQIHSFGNFYVENELINWGTDPSGDLRVLSGEKYKDLRIRTNKGQPGATPIEVGAGTYWNASSKFTGTAHYALRWRVSDKRTPNGVPSRYTLEGEGALVYDPRKDSTRGGSGSHRADDQTTWAYSTLDGNGKPIGRNNALQVLWYLIGWRINNVLVCGRGISLDDIDFAGFIAAANDAEARGHYTDMILSTGDSHDTNEGVLTADGLLGELLDPGGLWNYRVTKDDTADIAVALNDDHVVEGTTVQWTPEVTMGDRFNEVSGTYVDATSQGLYQSKTYPLVTDAAYVTADGFRKRTSHNFQCIQDPALAQKLARIKLNRNRFNGEFVATFNFIALKAQLWDVVSLSLERYGFVSKLFRIHSQAVTEAGVEMVLKEEHASIYAGGTVTVETPPSARAAYNMHTAYTLPSLASFAISLTSGGNTSVGARLTWTALTAQVRRIELEYKRAADSIWLPGALLEPEATSVDLLGFFGSTSYNVRIRTWNMFEIPSAWQTATLTTAAASADWTDISGVPSTVQNANVSIGANGALVGGGGGQVTITGLGYVGTLDANSLGDGNRVRYSLFESGLIGWQVLDNPGISITPSVETVSGRKYFKAVAVFTAGSQTFSMATNHAEATRIRVNPSERLSVQARVGTSLSSTSSDLVVWWIDAAGAFINSSSVSSWSGVLANGTLRSGFVTAPANAYGAMVLLYCASTVAGTATCHLGEVMVCSAGAGQTTHSPFTPGPSNEYGADVTTQIVGPSAVNINYDYTGATIEQTVDMSFWLVAGVGGAILTDQLVTATYKVVDGTVNGFNTTSAAQGIGVSDSVGTLTVSTLATDTATIEVSLTRAGMTRKQNVVLTKVKAAQPASGGGGGGYPTSQTSGFVQVPTPWTTFANIITDRLQITMPTGKTTARVVLALNPKWLPKTGQPQWGPWNIEAKIQRNTGTTGSPTWTDIGSVQNSNPDPFIDSLDEGFIVTNAGTINYTFDDTGRTAGSTYEYRVVMRVSSGTTTSNTGGISNTGSVTLSAP